MSKLINFLYQVVCYRLVCLVTKQGSRTFFFNSFDGRLFSGNIAVMFDGLVKKFPNGHFIVWLLDDVQQKELLKKYPEVKISFVKQRTIGFLRGLAKAKYWLMDVNFPERLTPQKNGKFIQLWHGTPLKHIAADLPEDNEYRAKTLKESKNWDYFISNAISDNWIYRQAFNLDDSHIIPSGLPRNDFLVAERENTVLKMQLQEGLKLPQNRLNILYAPTFRDDESQFKLAIDLEQFEKVLGDKFNLILRLHPHVAKTFKLSNDYSHVIDASSYPDIQELFLVADMLITDYSSVFFDYSLLNRPILFYAYDFDKFKDNLRGFYYDYQRFVPGPIVYKRADLLAAIPAVLKQNGQVIEQFARDHNANYQDNAVTRIIKQIGWE
ncbi:CDP-Glycerol:Poly(Glycerophosphate) glycerophosphotransferase family protein [Latilactobacillus sakei]|uniref:CDP-glycerol glycerophosphotransferase family protein n=1 Tax=Latilactobacillus sakei TaxID=1599 RepID=UPI000C13A88B|nr:CDP-glycerol glycerophosphotransferase family protein [Latilactobacillus sakei]MCP8856248.1 CDP-glycerol glycerophosphotransferase family protein [Latilactobacillus sakei]SOB40037.1 CDP-Glycerol:Poly(Glycerophosphate) glycerophosphotransferase family protein [Latilactobacillus sakei]